MRNPAINNKPFSSIIEHAIELAAQWHDGTYRKSSWRDPAFRSPEGTDPSVPVMSHVTMVGMMVQRAGWDEITVAAAFLHDVLEDPDRHKQYMRYEVLQSVMGAEVADRVLEVTEEKFDGSGNSRSWQQRKEGYISGLRSHSPEAIAISLADKTHNLWTMNESLSRGIDIFTTAPGRRGLNADPERQRWFHRAVLETSREFDDPRLESLRNALEHEIERFEKLLNLV